MSIAAGHRPAACTRVRSDPGLLLYFSAVLIGRSAAVRGRRGSLRVVTDELRCRHAFDLTLLPMSVRVSTCGSTLVWALMIHGPGCI